MNFLGLFTIFFSALLINNIVLMRFLALCAFFGVSDKMEASKGMSAAVAFVMVMATTVTWCINNYILKPYNLTFLRTVSFILVIASLVQLVELFTKKYAKNLYHSLGIYLPLITTNCAIFGVTLLSLENNINIVEAIVYSIGVSAGFALAIIVFAGIRQRLVLAPIPKSIQGYPIVFFTAALMSLAFMGFSGLFGLY